MNKEDITVIICCAGMGTRLGIGHPKALIDVDGKPLIIRILEQLNDYNDIRIVVGFQAELVIEIVKNYRKDIMFVFNYDFMNTSIVDSVNKALPYSRKYVVEIDGDLLMNKDDFYRFMEFPNECVGVTEVNSECPVFVKLENGKVIGFSDSVGNKEWTGLVKLESKKMYGNGEFIFENISKYLPLPYVIVDAKDIDTTDDYDKTIEWFLKNKEKKGE